MPGQIRRELGRDHWQSSSDLDYGPICQYERQYASRRPFEHQPVLGEAWVFPNRSSWISQFHEADVSRRESSGLPGQFGPKLDVGVTSLVVTDVVCLIPCLRSFTEKDLKFGIVIGCGLL